MLSVVSLILLHVLCTTCTAETAVKNISYFLPKSSFPNHYDINLRTYLDDVYKYEGVVNINITVLKETDNLVLHSEDVQVDLKKSFVYGRIGTVKIISGKENSENHFLNLKLENTIEKGDYVLRILFAGTYYSTTKGLFLSSYSLPNGKKNYMVATHLEPIGARSIFPCYDEPNLKATFKLIVIHPKDYHAISNSPIKSVVSKGKISITSFEKTEKMSTYLLALAVSDFETLEGSHNGKPVRLFVRPDKVADTEFSLKISEQTLHFFEKLLEVKYTLPKLDGVVVPTFGGGMENWGLIVYGNSVVVKNSSANTNRPVNLLVHEIAHQWFGNLVTCDWWDHIWLNEGFATYYASRVADMIMPSERFMYKHYVGNILRLRYDESRSSATDSLTRHVEKPNELRSKFNSISYDKGSVIVRFMSLIFKNYDYAISKYLQKFSFRNTVPSDLFKVINERTPLPIGSNVGTIMKPWISNPGYPLLTLNITHSDGTAMIELTQERFTLDGTKLPERWWIPVTLTVEEYPYFETIGPAVWLREQDESIITYVGNATGWIIANLQQAVYCRVNYDLENWRKIIAYLKGPNYQKIHVLNRIQLIEDSNNLAKSQRLPEKIALDLLSYLKNEEDELVLKAAEASLVSYAELLRNTPVFENYKNFVIDIVGDRAANIFDENQHLKELVEEAADEISQLFKNNLVLYKLIERIYTKEKLSEVQKIAEKNAMARQEKSFYYKQLWEEISIRAALNLEVKERFFIHNYPEVKSWLYSSKY